MGERAARLRRWPGRLGVGRGSTCFVASDGEACLPCVCCMSCQGNSRTPLYGAGCCSFCSESLQFLWLLSPAPSSPAFSGPYLNLSDLTSRNPKAGPVGIGQARLDLKHDLCHLRTVRTLTLQ